MNILSFIDEFPDEDSYIAYYKGNQAIHDMSQSGRGCINSDQLRVVEFATRLIGNELIYGIYMRFQDIRAVKRQRFTYI